MPRTLYNVDSGIVQSQLIPDEHMDGIESNLYQILHSFPCNYFHMKIKMGMGLMRDNLFLGCSSQWKCSLCLHSISEKSRRVRYGHLEIQKGYLTVLTVQGLRIAQVTSQTCAGLQRITQEETWISLTKPSKVSFIIF